MQRKTNVSAVTLLFPVFQSGLPELQTNECVEACIPARFVAQAGKLDFASSTYFRKTRIRGG
jgi:hypothetical protein